MPEVTISFRTKLLIVSFLVLFISALNYIFHINLKTGVVITHLFYIPVVLSCLWWKRQGLWVTPVIGFFLLTIDFLVLGQGDDTMSDLYRLSIFFFTGIVVAVLSEIIEKQNLKLLHNSKLSSLGFLASGVAHEINNPLSILRGMTDLLRERVCKQDNWSPDLEKLYIKQVNAIDRIAKMVTSMQTYSHGNEGVVKFEITPVLEHALILAVPFLQRRGIYIDKRLANEPLFCFGQITDFQQIIISALIECITLIDKDTNSLIIKSSLIENMIELEFSPLNILDSPLSSSNSSLKVIQDLTKKFSGNLKTENIYADKYRLIINLIQAV